MLKLLLQHGANPNARYRDTTVAHQVIENGTFAKLFLELPSLDIEAIDSEGTTLFLTACHKGLDCEKSGEKHSLPRILVDRGVNIYARDKKGGNALHHLLKNFLLLEDQDMLRRIAAEPDLINSPDNEGRTPIHIAVGRPTRVRAEKLISSCPLVLILRLQITKATVFSIWRLLQEYGRRSQARYWTDCSRYRTQTNMSMHRIMQARHQYLHISVVPKNIGLVETMDGPKRRKSRLRSRLLPFSMLQGWIGV